MKKLVNFLAIVLPHVSIVISTMYIVFFVINNYNNSMKFLDFRSTPQTFVLLLILSLSSIVCSALLIAFYRKNKRLEYRLTKEEKEN